MIYGIEPDTINNPNILDNIIADNDLNVDVNDIKIVTKLKYKNVFDLVIEVNPGLFSVIINRSFLFVGWKKCGVKEHFNLLRCYKCCKFGHLKKDCKGSAVCSKCSGSHEYKDCDVDSLICSNCKNFNEKLKVNFSVNHSANDPLCHFRKYKIDQLKSKINYESGSRK